MLTFIRRIIYSRVGVVITLGVLVLIALAFAAGDITGLRGNNNSGGLTGTDVATVGGTKVGEAEVKQRATSAFENYRQQQPTLDMAAFVAGGGVQAVIDRAVNGLALQQFAESIGMAMSKKAVDGEIASLPNFQGLDGKFNQKTYEQVLQQSRITDKQLRDDIVRDSLARQLLAPTLGAGQMPEQLALPYASLLFEKRSGTVGSIPVTAVNVGAKPTDADITAFYTRNRARYTVPERRVARYAIVRAADMIAKSAPSEADLAAAYKKQAARFAASEKRTVTQVVVATQSAATDLANKVKGGTALAAAARTAGLEPSTFTGLQKAALAQQSAQPVADAAFAAAKGAVVGPIRAPLGWVVLHVDTVEAIAAKSFDQAKPELTAELSKMNAANALVAIHDKIDDAAGQSSTFDEIVADAKLTAQATPPLLASGINPDAPTAQPDPLLARIVGTAFTAESGDAPQLVQIDQDGSFAVVGVGQITPAAPRPLAQIKDRVTQDIGTDRAIKAARAVAIQVIAKVNKGMPLAQALTETGLKLAPVEQRTFTRAQLAQEDQQKIPAWVKLMFSMRAKTAKLNEAPNNAGYIIVALDNIQSGNAAGNAEVIKQTRGGLGSVTGREFAEQFTAAVRNSVGVKRNAAEVERIKASMAGTGGE